LDEATLLDLAERQVRAKVDALVVAGTTGEGLALTTNEFESVVRTAVEAADTAPRHRRPLVIAGTGSVSTSQTADLTERAAALGADAALVVAPFYQRPTQAGVRQHFLTIADEQQLPIIVYNSPERTGCNVEHETLSELSEHEWIVGYKEASPDFRQHLRVTTSTPGQVRLLVGRDEFAVPLLLMGWSGVVSVVANLDPDLVKRVVGACFARDLDQVHMLQRTYHRWIDTTHVEVSPVPTKAALAMLGQCRDVVRPPLVPLTEAQADGLHAELSKLLPASQFAPRTVRRPREERN
jgi:4-hydroxy-tetrahydrodipicolinate synthase